MPNPEVRTRVLQGAGQIDVITPFFTSPSFTDRLRGIATALSASRYELVVYTVDSVERLHSYLDTLPIKGMLAGLVIMSLPVEETAAQRLWSNGLETVLIENKHPGFSSILVDDREGGRIAAQYLSALGHRRCAYVYFGEHPAYSIHPEVQRLEGFREALTEQGIALPAEYIQYVPVSRQGIMDKLRSLPEERDPPTAMLRSADGLAIRVIFTFCWKLEFAHARRYIGQWVSVISL